MSYTLHVNDGRTTETHVRCTYADITDAIAWLNAFRNGDADDAAGHTAEIGPAEEIVHRWSANGARRATTLRVCPNVWG